MTKSELRERLRSEVRRWEQKTFQDLAALTFPVTYAIGAPNDPAFYQTEVTLLEKTPEYIHLAGGGLGRRRRVPRPREPRHGLTVRTADGPGCPRAGH